MDSLTSVELRNRLQMELGCVLPTTLTFDCPNVAAVKRYLAESCGGMSPRRPRRNLPGPTMGWTNLTKARLRSY